MLDRLAREHEVRACYEASGAGYVLERMIRSWGHECEIVAPSLIPQRPGQRRKHDRKDAEELARPFECRGDFIHGLLVRGAGRVGKRKPTLTRPTIPADRQSGANAPATRNPSRVSLG